jgi:hypothetical protein
MTTNDAIAPGGQESNRATRSSRHTGSPYADIPTAALGVGALFGIGAFVIAAIFMGLDYFSVRDVSTEHAVVVAVGPSGTKETCGPKALWPDTPGERTTYRSADPPPGLPAEFTWSHCPGLGDELGAEVIVRRAGTTEDDVYVDPIESAGQWLGMAAIVGVATFVIAGLLAGIRETWGAYRTLRKIRVRHLDADEEDTR